MTTSAVATALSRRVGFGVGIHRCVGQHLSRFEGEALISTLATRVSRIEIAAEPVRRVTNGIRGWSSLPLALTPV